MLHTTISKFHNLKLSFKLTLTISFVCFIALTVFSTTTITIYKNIMVHKEIRSTLTNLDTFRGNLNDYLNGIDKSSVLLIYSASIQDSLAGNPDLLESAARLEAYRDILQRIREIVNNSYGISAISIIDNYNNVFTFGDNSRFLSSATDMDYTATDWFRRAVGMDGKYRWEIADWSDSKRTIQMVRSIKSTRNQQTLGVVQFTISPDILKTLFTADSKAEGDYSLVVNSGEIYTQDASDKQQAIIDTSRMTGSSGHYTRETDGTKYLVTYSTNPLTDWKFIYAIDRNILFKDINHIYFIWAIFFLLSLSLITLISVKISRSISRPLKTLTQLNEEVEKGNLNVIFQSQYTDEVGMLGLSFNRMLENIREGIPLRREKLVRSILEQNISIEEFRELNRLTDLPLHRPFYQVAIIDFAADLRLDKLRSLEQRLYQYEETTPMVCFTLKPGQYGILFNESKETTARVAEELVSYCQKALEFMAVAYIGGHYPEIHFVKNSYEEAKELMKYRFFIDSHCIRYDAVMAQHWQIAYPDKLENQLKYYVELRSLEQCRQIVGSLLAHMKDNGIQPFIIQALLSNAYIYVHQLSVKNKIEPSLIFGSRFGHDDSVNDPQRSLPQKFDDFLDIVGKYISEFEIVDAKQISAAIATAVKIIDKDFPDYNLGIDYMAERLNINGVYFSQLFKKDMGISFIEYLNRVRLANAQRLLKETNLKIKDIAKETGYADSHYFGIWFKDKTGLTPSQYRNQ